MAGDAATGRVVPLLYFQMVLSTMLCQATSDAKKFSRVNHTFNEFKKLYAESGVPRAGLLRTNWHADQSWLCILFV